MDWIRRLKRVASEVRPTYADLGREDGESGFPGERDGVRVLLYRKPGSAEETRTAEVLPIRKGAA